MPELPEVETVARGVAKHITGLTIDGVDLLRADIAHGEPPPTWALVRGRRIERVHRLGKHVCVQLSGDLSLHVHLGMTGRLLVANRGEVAPAHTHLRIRFRRRRIELRFCDPRRFGGVWLINDAAPGASGWVGRRLPPVHADPLELSPAAFRRLVNRRRQIKALLMSQEPISGVGNIYCDEALHRAGLHPLRRASELSPEEVRRLHLALRRVLREAIAAGGSSINDYRSADNAPGWFQVQHRVYGRAGQPCRSCRTSIERLVVAGRGTFICPSCQSP